MRSILPLTNMSAARLKSLGKLVVLIGLPVAFVVGLFGAGVYVGHGHRAAILGFERDWLGLDVEVPGEPPKPTSEVTPPAEQPKPAPQAEPRPEPKPEPKLEAPPAEPPKPTSPTEAPAQPTPEPKPASPGGLPIAVVEPAPLPPELQARLAEPLKVRVKVVVDEEVFNGRSDWIDYAERHVRWASQVLQRQLGVELELRGVVAGPVTWSSGQVALDELASVSREGADLVLGLGGRSVRAPVQAGPTSTQRHASTAVAFTDPSSPAPHLRSLLRAICHAMGADPVGVEPGPVAFAAEDRRVILERKHLPFSPATAPAADGAPEGED